MSAADKSNQMQDRLKAFSSASKKKAASLWKAFYDPLRTVNAYNVFWLVIWLLSFGIIGVVLFMDAGSERTLWIAGMAGGIALLTSLGAFYRFYYASNWSTLSRVETVADPFDPTIYSGVVER